MSGFATRGNRISKAKKIESILSDFLEGPLKDKKILDIGTGSGEIAEYFTKNNKVYSVDVVDQRKNKKSGVIFKKVNSERLPFEDSSFDIIISNVVMEHTKNQNLHLKEIKRVLKQRGVCYLAAPNRLFPFEVHYKVWFIHYLPDKLFFKLLKLLGKYEEDIYLLSYFNLIKLISKYFSFEEYTHKIIKYPQKFGFKAPIINKFPSTILKKLNFLSPTNVFVLRK